MPAGDDTQRLRTLVDGVVRAQGNEYIKDLLRRKNLARPAAKDNLVATLSAAVDAGELTAADVQEWLHEVEGWGNQHIYVYRLPPALANDPRWDTRTVRRRVTAAGLGDLWDAETSYEFPDALTLTGISARDGRVAFVWHQGVETLTRVPEKDFEREEDDEAYVYLAHVKRRVRTVVRFVVRVDLRIAAAFVQVPITAKEHKPAVDALWDAVGSVVTRDELGRFDIAKAIRRIDEDESATALRTNMVRLDTTGAWIAYGAFATDVAYRDVADAREARKAVTAGKAFTGRRSDVLFAAPSDGGPAKAVQVRLDADDRRLWVRAQLTERQVWGLLGLVARYA